LKSAITVKSVSYLNGAGVACSHFKKAISGVHIQKAAIAGQSPARRTTDTFFGSQMAEGDGVSKGRGLHTFVHPFWELCSSQKNSLDTALQLG
jgi:hypothetical protein